jgi:hypothetical protein
MREYQVRFCEGLGVKFPGPTRPGQQSTLRAQDRVGVSQALERIRQAAKHNKKDCARRPLSVWVRVRICRYQFRFGGWQMKLSGFVVVGLFMLAVAFAQLQGPQRVHVLKPPGSTTTSRRRISAGPMATRNCRSTRLRGSTRAPRW